MSPWILLPGQVTVLATKEQQTKIGEVITKSAEPKPDNEMRLPSRMKFLLVAVCIPHMLQQTFRAYPGDSTHDLTSPLVVLATEEEHTRIAAMVEELKLQVETASR